MKQGKVVICNVIMMLISVAAIVTLIVGSFMNIDIKLNIDGEKLASAGETGTPGGSGSEGEMLKDVKVTLPLSLEMTSMSLIKSVFEDPSEQVSATIESVAGKAVDAVLAAADDIMVTMVTVVVDGVVAQAEEQIEQKLAETVGEGNVTQEQIKEKLENDYDVTEADVETLKTEVSDTMKALLNGETEDATKCLEESTTLDKLIAIYAEEALKEELGTETVTEAEINAKAAELKNETIDEYEKMIDEMKVDGEFNKEAAVVSMLSNADIKDENGNAVEFNNIDDVKAYLSVKVNSLVGEDMEKPIALAMKALGIFIIVVIAAWAYFLIKLIVKTLFARKNKTVGMFFPKFFGWMPHVIFVGLPMLVLKNLDKIVELVATKANMPEVSEMLAQYSSLATIDIASLTWVSALCSVALLIIWIPYYRWRRRLKREAKAK
ncbi:MAG: hypothetical protein ACI4M8_01515 [Christensenellales bacterium]